MTITEMLWQSLMLTVSGMAVVFLFLIIMITFIILNSKLIKLLKLDREENATNDAMPAQGGASGTNTAVIAAIAAAVREKQNS
ncbi:OadG family protein [Treponema sp. OMZ 840]|uniref:OadG family protein n=1 Tax=Treponema sp. OMZ 840 TaxID=244313 RepID=UPI003D8A140A